jgi:hypothetical protein
MLATVLTVVAHGKIATAEAMRIAPECTQIAPPERPPWRAAVRGRAICAPTRLDSSREQKNNDDQKNEAEAAGRVISPAAAIGPRRQCADQENDEDYYQDCTEHYDTVG